MIFFRSVIGIKFHQNLSFSFYSVKITFLSHVLDRNNGHENFKSKLRGMIRWFGSGRENKRKLH